MPEKVALAIGVSQSGTLIFLPGARTGAEQFATWAESQGFDVIRLIDEDDRKITARDIYDAIENLPQGVKHLFSVPCFNQFHF